MISSIGRIWPGWCGSCTMMPIWASTFIDCVFWPVSTEVWKSACSERIELVMPSALPCARSAAICQADNSRVVMPMFFAVCPKPRSPAWSAG